MSLSKHYDPKEAEPRLQAYWQAASIYHFAEESEREVYSIDTPPATVSGHLHLGHVYSYTHPDLIARFRRMRGDNVFYPMGYDDNGLPTERLVEKRMGVTASQLGRRAFIEKCLQVSEEAEKDYQALWQRLGLSIDWRYSYRTIDERSRRISQKSFLDLYRKGLVYRDEAPAIWCPECRTSIAQAELYDLERDSEFVFLDFQLEEGGSIPIATTRPELIPACVAVFIHPEDGRYKGLAGRRAIVPLFGQRVPVLEDRGADPKKGSGAVMCCTFGDTADVAWQREYQLPLIEAIDRQGRMTAAAGEFAGLKQVEARQQIILALEGHGLLSGRQPTRQTVRVHERCDTPVEYIIATQWFIRVLEFKELLLQAGDELNWHPEHMRARYRAWVENLNWDWCISRQRYFGVPFPLWYCRECGEIMLASEDQLPVDPLEAQPGRPCSCGSRGDPTQQPVGDMVEGRAGRPYFTPEEDVLDTWATSSLSPQIVGRGDLGDMAEVKASHPSLYERVFPMSLRPQAHEIIRTWAFYTIVKSLYHFGVLPWQEVLISGWGIAGEGMGKISKSRGGGPLPPMEMIRRYSADALRYWASSAGPGKDAVISEDKIQIGARLVTKLWNVARFSERFLAGYTPPGDPAPGLTPADRWILARQQLLVRRVTELMECFDYATAKNEAESFFWTELADNYLEMCKQRLYDTASPHHEAARFTLYHLLLTQLKLFAPFLPHITEEIYQGIFVNEQGIRDKGSIEQGIGNKSINSIHLSTWPEADPRLEDPEANGFGDTLVAIATAIRRYKSERNLALGSELNRLQLAVVPKDDGDAVARRTTADERLREMLQASVADLMSVTRARQIEITGQPEPGWYQSNANEHILIAIEDRDREDGRNG